MHVREGPYETFVTKQVDVTINPQSLCLGDTWFQSQLENWPS
jgi:hypothetical protein